MSYNLKRTSGHFQYVTFWNVTWDVQHINSISSNKKLLIFCGCYSYVLPNALLLYKNLCKWFLRQQCVNTELLNYFSDECIDFCNNLVPKKSPIRFFLLKKFETFDFRREKNVLSFSRVFLLSREPSIQLSIDIKCLGFL